MHLYQYLIKICQLCICSATLLPTLYEYYTDGGIKAGLSDANQFFILNCRNLTIFSGSLHYFRVPKVYWRDRLRKYRAAGLNSIQTYVPWNLHEHQNGIFDFGDGGSEFEDFLDIAHFIRLAKEEDLFVILRPGPFIDSEWEFGGLPSWLLRYSNVKIRTSDRIYIELVERYFEKLFEILSPLQFTKGGSIIAVQIENEYGNTYDGVNPVDTNYLRILRDVLRKNGVVELLFTSDTPSNGFLGTLPGVLATANFQKDPIKELALLRKYQPNKPLLVTEYWTGWFDHWTEKHQTTSVEEFERVLNKILGFGASINFYMFHGGTSWGFMNGADLMNKSTTATDNEGFQPDVTTYDYDAPISEAGDYREKYFKAKQLIAEYNKLNIYQPPMPDLVKRYAYPPVNITEELSMEDIIEQTQSVSIKKLLPMELLPINNNSGQSYGYIVYKKRGINIPMNSVLKIEGRVCDTVLVLLNGVLKNKILENKDDLNGFGFWRQKNSELYLGSKNYQNATLELVVENWGRINYGFLQQFNQHKGIWQGNVLLNSKIIEFDEIIPVEFKKTMNFKNWKKLSFSTGPKLYRVILNISEPRDTYVDMKGWNKGIVIINNFVIGRYLTLGPQRSIYLPASFLYEGKNEILIFEHFISSKTVKFVEDLIFV